MPLDNFDAMEARHDAERCQEEDSNPDPPAVQATTEGHKSESSDRPAYLNKDGYIIDPCDVIDRPSASDSSASSKQASAASPRASVTAVPL